MNGYTLMVSNIGALSSGSIRSHLPSASSKLARHNLLSKFDYLHVSGGGYIGSWLTAGSTEPDGLSGVKKFSALRLRQKSTLTQRRSTFAVQQLFLPSLGY